MRKAVLLLLLLMPSVGHASAQMFAHSFKNDPLGTNVSLIWQETKGNWKVSSLYGRHWLESNFGGFGNQYALAARHMYRNCCVQGYFPYRGFGFSIVGLTTRCLDPRGGRDGLDMVRARMGAVSRGYHGVTLSVVSPTGSLHEKTATFGQTPRVLLRLVAAGTSLEAQVDIDQDGHWDAVARVESQLTPKAGPVGFLGDANGLMGNFQLWDGAILDAPGSPSPKPGAVVHFKIAGAPGAAYQAATSLGNAGITMPHGANLALSPDALFATSVSGLFPSVFQNYRGVTNNNGEARISLAIPKHRALKGLVLYTGFVNHRAPMVLSVSNDHQVVIR